MDYDSKTVIPRQGELWGNSRSDEHLFVYLVAGHLKGIRSNGVVESDKDIAAIEHGKDGWTRLYPAVHEEE